MEDLIKEESKPLVPVCEKYTLTIREAAAYFNIGIKKIRRLAEENTGRFSVFSGNKYLIIRKKFEKFIDDSSEIWSGISSHLFAKSSCYIKRLEWYMLYPE